MTMTDQLKQIGHGERRCIILTDITKTILKRGLDTNVIMEVTGFSKDELRKFAQ